MGQYRKSRKAIFFCQYHLIWCPRYRRQLLIDDIKKRLENILPDIAHSRYAKIVSMEIMPDHVHVLIESEPKMAPHRIVQYMKGRTSNILRKEFPQLLKMPTLWTRSYFLSTIGQISTENVQEYIKNQFKQKLR